MGVYIVTGAAGFIGSNVTEKLHSAGHTVVGIDSLNNAYEVRLKEWRLSQLSSLQNFYFYKCDITNKDALLKIVESTKQQFVTIDAIIHLAAYAGVRLSVEKPWLYCDTNISGTLNILESCRFGEIHKVVVASSSSLYGTKNEVPFKESANTDSPVSPYAATKKAAEALCYSYHHLHGIDCSLLRFFTVYGPAGRPDMSVYRFVKWIYEEQPLTLYGDGEQSRDFTYVSDIADGVIKSLKDVGFEVFNLGSDSPVKMVDLIASIESIVGKKASVKVFPSHSADVEKTWADIDKARSMLGWSPETILSVGLKKTVDWYVQNRDWVTKLSV